MDNNWKDALGDTIPAERAHDIDIFEGQMHLRRQNKLEEKVSRRRAFVGALTASAMTTASASTGVETRLYSIRLAS